MVSRHRLILVLIGLALLVSASTAFGAGGVSHYYIGRRAAEKIVQDLNAPPDLREALAGEDGMAAFSSGAVSPDLPSFNHPAHNGDKTAELPAKLLAKARADLDAAKALEDSDASKIEKFREAQKELAFSYGWLCHVATDLDVHPIVNRVVGDAYAHNDTGKRISHAAQEVQLDFYVDKAFREDGEKISFDIPYSLVAECTEVPEDKLEANVKLMRMKMMEELVGKNTVTIPPDKLAQKWEQSVEDSIADTVKFAEDPDSFKGWDIDCGRLTTAEFEALRDAAIAANAGELPKNWGAKYLEWYTKTKGLSGNKLKDALVLLMNGKELPKPISRAVTVKLTRNHSRDCRVFVNGQELLYNKELEITTDESRVLQFKVLPLLYSGDDWLKYTEVYQDTPYACHYKFDDGKFPESGKASVVKGKWEWTRNDTTPQKDAYSSGGHASIAGDVLDWVVPGASYRAELDPDGMKQYMIYVGGKITWNITKWIPGEMHSEPENLHGDIITILVPGDK